MIDLSYKRLKVWEKSKNLCLFIYKLTNKFPKEETYGLISQIRRCVISIPSNIAEGYAKSSIKENLRFIEIAYGSYYELNTQIEIAQELGYIEFEDDFSKFKEMSEELGKMIYSYIKVLRNKIIEKEVDKF